MRFHLLATAAACLPACIAPTVALKTGENKVAFNAIANDDNTVPGDSPLKYCSGDHGNDVLHIKKVDLSPNPPEAGKTLVIKASGEVKQNISEGAYVWITVKYGVITLIHQKVDLCAEVGKIDLECPIEPGNMEITKSVDLPKEIPPGKYTATADALTKDDEKITCLTAAVSFNTGKGFFSNDL